MVLFRHVSLRERWELGRPKRVRALALATACAAAVVDQFTGTDAIHAARPAHTKPFRAEIRTPNANSGGANREPNPGRIT